MAVVTTQHSCSIQLNGILYVLKRAAGILVEAHSLFTILAPQATPPAGQAMNFANGPEIPSLAIPWRDQARDPACLWRRQTCQTTLICS